MILILRNTLKAIPRKQKSENRECGEYFNLTCKLLDLYYSIPEEKKKLLEVDILALLKDLVVLLKNHKTSEKRNTLFEDKLMIGYFEIIRKTLSHHKEYVKEIAIDNGLLREIFFNCLFPNLAAPEVKSTTELPTLQKSDSQELTILDSQKCKTQESRLAAYKLIAATARCSTEMQAYLLKVIK